MKNILSREIEIWAKKRFWPKVHRTDKCWVWKASRSKPGYGQIEFLGKIERAHRVSWIINNGRARPKRTGSSPRKTGASKGAASNGAPSETVIQPPALPGLKQFPIPVGMSSGGITLWSIGVPDGYQPDDVETFLNVVKMALLGK